MRFTYSGPEEESVFHDFNPALLVAPGANPENAADGVLAPIQGQLHHLHGIHDFQLGILYGAVLVENALDELLSILMPRFEQEIGNNADFTFSTKTRMARALSVCPRRILGSADSIRNARNAIAHNLQFGAYDDLPIGIRDSINHRRREYYNPQADAPAEEGFSQFVSLVVYTTTALMMYASHSRLLRGFIDNEEFVTTLEAHVQGEGGGGG
jgi:hypothetical protein